MKRSLHPGIVVLLLLAPWRLPAAAETTANAADAAPTDAYRYVLDEAACGGWRRDELLDSALFSAAPAPAPLRVVRETVAGSGALPESGGQLILAASRDSGAVGLDNAAEAAAPRPAGICREVGADRGAWARGRVLSARIYVPVVGGSYPAAPAAASAAAQLVACHPVWGWFGAFPTRPLHAGQWTTVRWPLGMDCPEWESLESAVAWNDTIRKGLSRVGLRIYFGPAPDGDATSGADWSDAGSRAATPAPVEIRIADIVIEGLEDPVASLKILNIRSSADGESGAIRPEGRATNGAERGKRFELTFDLSRWYDNPFDPGRVAVDVDFLTPSGKTITLPAFYFQDFERRRLSDATEDCQPRGLACWKARFTPQESGRHYYRIRVEDREYGARNRDADAREHEQDKKTADPPSVERYETPPASFEVADAPFRGFLRVDKDDPRFLSFDDRSLFYPIGLIVRSPWDERRLYFYEFEIERGRGTYDYDEYFTSMSAAGINFTRVWMSAWWTALEWSHGYNRNYPGLGRYNLLNAWRLDYVVELAERLDLLVDLTLHNHGQFSMRIDAEWPDNPYFTANGGPLDSPDQFWGDRVSRRLVRNRLRYIVARWGYSPAIAFWELFNEVNLVHNYDGGAITEWHEAMSDYLRQLDPYQHIVSTHYTRGRFEKPLMELPGIQVTQSNGYSADMIAMSHEILRYLGPLGKPAYINEFGVGQSPAMAQFNLHSGLWASTVLPYCGPALYWYWHYIHGKNEYYQYEALARFNAGEDYRGRCGQTLPIAPVEGAEGVEFTGMKDDRMARLWLYDTQCYRGGQGERPREPAPRPIAPVTLALDGMQAGRYRAQFWDTWKGVAVESREIELAGDAPQGRLTIQAPAFARDLACKIDRVEHE